MIGKRRRAREQALQLLYALELSQNAIEEVFGDPSVIRPDGSPFDTFTKKLVEEAQKTAHECTALIAKHAHNWELSRIALIDRLILRLAITEFLCFSDIPPKVTINEALEIAKRFSTSESGRFINGILDVVLAELVAEHKLFKEGRGLATETKKAARKKT